MTREQDLGNDDEPTPDGALSRFVADARSRFAADARSRERWLREQAAEEMTWRGVATDLAELAGPVLVTNVNGGAARGVIAAVGSDHLCLAAAPDRRVLMPFHAIATLRPEPGAAVSGDRAEAHVDDAADLRTALAALADDRPVVTATTLGPGESVTGELRSVGRDVAVLALGPRGRDVVYLRLSSLAELSVIVSG